uniref:RNA-directed RNA polymerase n=1 Tax=Hubei levi-like virus 11 TaxID=1922910 RepID=A0A1L3KIG5_9VIRU|nr:hypothetical protein [Hubei levi-like virus 11]
MSKKPRLNLAARTFSVEHGVFLRTCEAIGTARALTCYMLAHANEWDQYLDLTAPDHESPSFADDYLVTEAMRKNPHLTTSHNPRKAAVETWWGAERQCAATNDRLVAYSRGDVSPTDMRTNEIIDRARHLVSQILGPLSRRDLEFAESKFRFGPGATSVVTGKDVVPSKKYMCTSHITPRLYPYWRSLVHLNSTSVELRAYSRVTFVAKTSKTDRAIAIEPHMNVYVQLGIGALLRQKLSRFGINLDKQADVNRRLASVAHLLGLATVDLSSASDTIASELVWLLLPYEWACLLDVARTEYSEIDGEEVRLSKFSSMGNGFTFELESLIFLALARAAGDPNAVAFGDDIILQASAYPSLKGTLDFLGFSVNQKKTFLAGRFFESCGYDYLDGAMVRPFYLKGNYHDFAAACIRISNKIRIYSHTRARGSGCDVRFIRVWSFARGADSQARSTYLPIGFGNDGIIVNFDEAAPALPRFGYDGYIARVLRQRMTVHDASTLPGAVQHALHRTAPDLLPGYDPDSPRLRGVDTGIRPELLRSREVTRRFSHTSLGNQIVPYWPNLGPWTSVQVPEEKKPSNPLSHISLSRRMIR